MAVQDVDGDIRPHFAEAIRKGVASDGISKLAGESTKGPSLAGIVRKRDRLCDSPAQQFGSVKAGVSLIVWRDHHTRGGINNPLYNTALSHGVVALILMEDRGHQEDDHIAAIRLIRKPTPVVSPESGYPFPELRVRIGSLRQQKVTPTKINDE